MKEKIMKEITNNLNIDEMNIEDDLLPEYDFDYSKAVKNPYYKKNRVFIEIDEEILETFQNQNNINAILKSIATSLEKSKVAVL